MKKEDFNVKNIARIFCVLMLSLAGFAQTQPTGPNKIPLASQADTGTFSASGQTLFFKDGAGMVSNQFEIVVNNSPATLTLNIYGCMPGGTCTPSPLASTSGTSSQNLAVTGPYDSYQVTETWTGGSSATSIKVNRLGSPVGKNGGGAAISGTLTAGHCISAFNATTIQDAGAACGAGAGNVVGPGSSVANNIALFGDTTGKLIADAGFGFPLAASHIGTLSAGSNGLGPLSTQATPCTVAQGCSGTTTAPSSGQILIGNVGGTAYAPQSLSGDSTLSNTGVMLNKQLHLTETAINNASSPYSVVAADSVITCDATAGAVTINLPAATATGRQITFKKIDSSANACTLTRAGADLIDGATTYAVSVQYASSSIVDTASTVWSRTHVSQMGGDISGLSSSAKVTSINNTLMSGLGSGFLMNTTGTGVPSINALLSDNGTTLTYGGTGGVSSAKFGATGGGAGLLYVTQGTAQSAVANSWNLMAPTTITTGYIWTVPAAQASVNSALLISSAGALSYSTLSNPASTGLATFTGSMTGGGGNIVFMSGASGDIAQDTNLTDAAGTLTYSAGSVVISSSTGNLSLTGSGTTFIKDLEGATPGGSANNDLLWANSAAGAHRWFMNNNNTGAVPVGQWLGTTAGDILYGGTASGGIAPETRLAGNASGTATLTESATGVASWGAGLTWAGGNLTVVNIGATGTTGTLNILGTTAGVAAPITTLAGGLTLVFPTGTTTNPGLNFVSNGSNSGFIGNGAGGMNWISSGTATMLVGANGVSVGNANSYRFNRTGTAELGLGDNTAATGAALLSIDSTAIGNEGGLLRDANSCRITADVSLTVNVANSFCSFSLPGVAKGWGFVCDLLWNITAGTGTNNFALGVNASQTPTGTTNANGTVYTTATGTETDTSTAISASGATNIATGATYTPGAGVNKARIYGTVLASATAGTFAITATANGTTATANVKAGTTCQLI